MDKLLTVACCTFFNDKYGNLFQIFFIEIYNWSDVVLLIKQT
jgi:hypothetical protein